MCIDVSFGTHLLENSCCLDGDLSVSFEQSLILAIPTSRKLNARAFQFYELETFLYSFFTIFKTFTIENFANSVFQIP